MLSIVARDLRVEFPIYDTYGRSLRHRLGLGRIANNINRTIYKKLAVGGTINIGSSGRTVITALNGINFEISEGERVAILGHNGSGKTTLLRTMAQVYEPIDGEIHVSGRVTPLFDMQLGMDEDATGIENVWLRGRMLDLSAKQIADSIDDVAEFTELGDYLYMPTRTYSAGMMVRLAFGISTVVTPEILVLDEMIGAGDEAFFRRARVRLDDFIAKTGILILASHSMDMLREWCTKGMLLEHGNIVAFGPINEVIARYEGRSAA
jgi:ABC-2 type transport system ATP-binding protein/lipopolysaccharide transport system ATP-binding protein